MGTDTACVPYGPTSASLVQNGAFCSAPPLFLYFCDNFDGEPVGFDDCYAFDNSSATYCAHDACTRYDPYDSVCAMYAHPSQPSAFQCATTTSPMPSGCGGPYGALDTWCCP